VRSYAYTAAFMAELATLLLSSATLAAQPGPAEDSDALLERIKAHTAEHLAQLPNYTCHETMDRLSGSGGNWQYRDRLELEVAFAGKEELFAGSGSERFGEQSLDQIASGGTFGNSPLGSHVDSIFSRNIADFKYAGEGKKEGRKTVRYDFRVPIERSLFHVHRAGVSGVAGYEGTVWVDADTLDLVRVDFKVNQIPSYVGVRLILESLHYRKLKIGNSEYTLPDRSELRATDEAGRDSLNMIKLDRCHEYSADSVVKYGAPTQGTADRERTDH
jgi:hypothetical protein